MTGKTSSASSSNNVDNKWKKVEAILQQFEEKHGLNKIERPSDIDKYMNLSYEVLTKLSPEDCAIGGAIIRNYALYLQKQENVEQARADWAQNELVNSTVQTNAVQGRYYSLDEKIHAMCVDNEYASRLRLIKDYSLRRVTTIKYLSSKMEALAKSLDSIGRTKRSYIDE